MIRIHQHTINLCGSLSCEGGGVLGFDLNSTINLNYDIGCIASLHIGPFRSWFPVMYVWVIIFGVIAANYCLNLFVDHSLLKYSLGVHDIGYNYSD